VEVSGNGSGSYTWWYVTRREVGFLDPIYNIRSPFLRFSNYGHLWYPRISQDGLQLRKMRKQTISRPADARRSFASAARKETHAFACRIENKSFPMSKRVRVLVMHPSLLEARLVFVLIKARDCCSLLNSRIWLGCHQIHLRSHDREWQTYCQNPISTKSQLIHRQGPAVSATDAQDKIFRQLVWNHYCGRIQMYMVWGMIYSQRELSMKWGRKNTDLEYNWAEVCSRLQHHLTPLPEYSQTYGMAPIMLHPRREPRGLRWRCHSRFFALQNSSKSGPW